MISTVIVAFSMFSAIPMPQTEWTNKSMRYALCAFPLIGAVIGALVCLWRFVCLRMEFSEWILAAAVGIPDDRRSMVECRYPAAADFAGSCVWQT